MYSESLSLLNTMALIFSMMRDRKVAKPFRSTNSQIYNALLKLDEGCIDPRPRNGWAGACSSWMGNYLQTQATSASRSMVQLSNRIISTTIADKPGELNEFGKALQAFTEAYPTSAWKYNTQQLLSVSRPRGRRDEPACPLTVSDSIVSQTSFTTGPITSEPTMTAGTATPTPSLTGMCPVRFAVRYSVNSYTNKAIVDLQTGSSSSTGSSATRSDVPNTRTGSTTSPCHQDFWTVDLY